MPRSPPIQPRSFMPSFFALFFMAVFAKFNCSMPILVQIKFIYIGFTTSWTASGLSNCLTCLLPILRIRPSSLRFFTRRFPLLICPHGFISQKPQYNIWTLEAKDKRHSYAFTCGNPTSYRSLTNPTGAVTG